MRNLGLKTFSLGFIFWYGLSLLNFNNNNIIDLNNVFYLIFLFFLFFLISYFLFYRNYKKLNIYNLDINSKTLIYLLIIFLILIFINFNMDEFGLIKRSYSLTAFSALLVYSYLCFSLAKTTQKKFFYLLLCILIILNLLDEYSRRYLLEASLAIIYLYVIQKNQIQFSDNIKLFILILLASLAYLYLTGLRETSSQADIENNILLGIDISLNALGFDCIYLTDFVMNFYSYGNYLNGETFFAGFVNFIPRAIWSTKPIAFSIILSSEYYNLNIDNIFTNFGPCVVAEAYANGGYFFSILIAIFFGISISKFDSYIDRYQHNLLSLLLAMIIYPSIFFLIRGDFVNGFFDLYSRSLIVVIIYYICKGKNNLQKNLND